MRVACRPTRHRSRRSSPRRRSRLSIKDVARNRSAIASDPLGRPRTKASVFRSPTPTCGVNYPAGRRDDSSTMRKSDDAAARPDRRGPVHPQLLPADGGVLRAPVREAAGGRRHFMTSRQRRSWILRRYRGSDAVAICNSKETGALSGRNRRQKRIVSSLVQAVGRFQASLQANACGKSLVAREPESG